MIVATFSIPGVARSGTAITRIFAACAAVVPASESSSTTHAGGIDPEPARRFEEDVRRGLRVDDVVAAHDRAEARREPEPLEDAAHEPPDRRRGRRHRDDATPRGQKLEAPRLDRDRVRSRRGSDRRSRPRGARDRSGGRTSRASSGACVRAPCRCRSPPARASSRPRGRARNRARPRTRAARSPP